MRFIHALNDWPQFRWDINRLEEGKPSPPSFN